MFAALFSFAASCSARVSGARLLVPIPRRFEAERFGRRFDLTLRQDREPPASTSVGVSSALGPRSMCEFPFRLNSTAHFADGALESRRPCRLSTMVAQLALGERRIDGDLDRTVRQLEKEQAALPPAPGAEIRTPGNWNVTPDPRRVAREP